jgi:hypothetical protein
MKAIKILVTKILPVAIVSVILLTGAACFRTEGPLAPAYTGLKEQLSGLAQQNGISVSGDGEVMAEPDIVQLSLGIQAQAITVGEAQRQARETMAKVMAVLRAQGIADKDIQTQSFSIQQVTRWNQKTNTNEIVGYRVDNMVSVKIRKKDEAGKIVDAVAEAGGDLTRIRGVSYAIDDPRPYYAEAREKAMKDAMAKAEQLARAANVKLGKAVYISETSAYLPAPRPVYADTALKAAEAPPPTEISPGELKIKLGVQVRFAIE